MGNRHAGGGCPSGLHGRAEGILKTERFRTLAAQSAEARFKPIDGRSVCGGLGEAPCRPGGASFCGGGKGHGRGRPGLPGGGRILPPGRERPPAEPGKGLCLSGRVPVQGPDHNRPAGGRLLRGFSGQRLRQAPEGHLGAGVQLYGQGQQNCI